MTFLSPGYLAGLLFVLLPVLLHLFHRRRQRRVLFSDLRFLRQAERQRSRRLRLREWVLLLLRILMIALLALAFARPVVKSSLPPSLAGTAKAKRILAILLDDSYSMGAKPSGKASLFEEAKERALEAMDYLHPGDEVLLLLCSDRPDVLTPLPTSDLERVRRMIQEARLSDRGTHLGPSITKGDELLSQVESPAKSLLIFSDFQKIALSSQGGDWSSPDPDMDLSLVLLPSLDRTLPNTAVVEARPKNQLLAQGKEAEIDIQMARYHDPEGNLTLSLWLDGKKAQESGVRFKATDAIPSARASFRVPLISSGIHEAVAAAERDLLPADDQRYLVLNVPEVTKVLLLTEQSGAGTPGFYLSKALAPDPEGSSFAVKVASPQALGGLDLRGFGALILSDVPLLTEGQLGKIEGFVQEEGGLLIVPGPHTDPGYYSRSVLPRLLPMTLGTVQEAPQGAAYSLAQFDVQHPALSLFQNRAQGDLSQARFLKVFPCKGGAETVSLARFTNGGSAILERALGRGKVIAFAFGLEQGATDLPLKAVFVPLVHQLLLYLSAQPAPAGSGYLVGQEVDRLVPGAVSSEPLILVSPDSSRATLEPRVAEGQIWVNLPEAGQAGIHRLLSGDKTLDAFAVNLDTRESDLSRFSEQELRRLFPKARIIRPEQSFSVLQAQDGEKREIWKLLLILVLLLAVVEMILRDKPKGKGKQIESPAKSGTGG